MGRSPATKHSTSFTFFNFTSIILFFSLHEQIKEQPTRNGNWWNQLKWSWWALEERQLITRKFKERKQTQPSSLHSINFFDWREERVELCLPLQRKREEAKTTPAANSINLLHKERLIGAGVGLPRECHSLGVPFINSHSIRFLSFFHSSFQKEEGRSSWMELLHSLWIALFDWITLLSSLCVRFLSRSAMAGHGP